jgi:hypothetical protein
MVTGRVGRRSDRQLGRSERIELQELLTSEGLSRAQRMASSAPTRVAPFASPAEFRLCLPMATPAMSCRRSSDSGDRVAPTRACLLPQPTLDRTAPSDCTVKLPG